VSLRPLRVAALLSAVVAAGFAVPAAGADAPRLAPEGQPVFPLRSFILSAPPGSRIDPAAIELRENGDRVRKLTIAEAGTVGSKAFGVTLLIDASESMRGRPIAAAMQAARAFAKRRDPAQPLSIVVFNRRPRVVLPPTVDAAAINRALATKPRLGAGTQTYDAIITAAAGMKAAGIAPGSIVVLSDGVCRIGGRSRCTRGQATPGGAELATAVAAARDARLRLFTVGLRGRYYDDSQLRALAAGGRGDFLEARSTADLAGIYSQLGARLANEYVISYVSHARPGNVHVAVRADGLDGLAVAEYVAPTRVQAATQRRADGGIWATTRGMLIVCGLSALLLGLALALLLVRRSPGDQLRGRVSAFVQGPGGDAELLAAPRAPRLTDRLWAALERQLGRGSRWAPFKERVEIARLKRPAERVAGLTGAGAVVLALLLGRTAGIAAGVLALIVVPFAVNAFINRKLRRQRTAFDDQLPDTMQRIASALRGGYSLTGAIGVIGADAPEPSATEFGRVAADERLGVPIETSLRDVSRRMASPDVEQLAAVAILQRETGGNIAEVLDRVTEVIRERNDLRRTVRVLTSQGRMARAILTSLPIVLLAILTVINPDYLSPLFDRGAGQVLLGVGALMLISGSLIIKKIVDVEV